MGNLRVITPHCNLPISNGEKEVNILFGQQKKVNILFKKKNNFIKLNFNRYKTHII